MFTFGTRPQKSKAQASSVKA